MADLDKLIRKRAVAKGNLTRFKHFVENLDKENPDLLQLELRLKKLDLCWQSFCEIQTEIELLDESEGEMERQNFENDYFKYEAMAQRLLKPKVGSKSDEEVKPRNMKLPEINLPTFNGEYSKWLYFKNSFNSVIHLNKSLPTIQKFHYLRSSLQGAAANVISSLEITEENYEVAWKQIVERFEKKGLLLSNHVTGLFDLPAVGKESHFALRSLLDKLNNHLDALRVLKQPVEHWDVLIMHMVTTKLDSVTNKEWETKNADRKEEEPTLKELIQFLDEKCDTLEKLARQKSANHSANQTKTKSLMVNDGNVSCAFCSDNHFVTKCEKFVGLSSDKRFAEIKQKGLCSNCLKYGHKNKSCPSTSVCKHCAKRHHTLLHFNSKKRDEPAAVPTNKSKTESNNQIASNNMATNNASNIDSSSGDAVTSNTSTYFTNAKNNSQTLLGTAMVQVMDKFGNMHTCRAVLDSASESHFCTQELADKLQTHQDKTTMTVSGINKTYSQLTHSTNIRIQSGTNNFNTMINCLIIPKITDNLPSMSFDINCLNIPPEITIADPAFNESDKIDLLIGAELFWRVIRVGQISLGKNNPILQNTAFGWIVSGKMLQSKINNCNFVSCNFVSTNSIDHNLTKFWELEERVCNVPLSPEEQSVEEYFKATTERDTNGKFVVRLPLNQSPDVLGDSRQTALKRLLMIEKKLNKSPDLQDQYVNFMKEYVKLGSAGFQLNKWASNNPDILKFVLDADPDSIINIGKKS
ncbi:hypothetical protein NQ315_013461 [Exocentrus adspersus]|uniref:Peptidase aspartic putative domain-containing protein n=1 Tax=Exocentrus adspersus TaxID=1586481 RepID=A0AAV8VEN2_9CUCU|nr:hypothetical protein NQ315_013461 [Exocentrus adspersus]